jgi:carbonic anhydrase/acetyltransferase-like protein (isoleucine patch superfamily)/enamine deaminase RidA (YjgF/YER057c/UK114 family)
VLIEHRGRRPSVHPSAWVAQTAVLSGDVSVGPDARVLHGAVLSGEDGRVEVGARCVVMEHALVRGRRDHHAVVGDDVLVGPYVHLNGARVESGCFLATGVSLFPGARLESDVQVRIGAVVHVNTRLSAGTMVPIGWVAVGDPATVLPPDRHDEIWAIQRTLDFPGTVYGVPRGTAPTDLMRRQSEWYGAHREDRVVDEPDRPGASMPDPERIERLDSADTSVPRPAPSLAPEAAGSTVRRGSGAVWEPVVGYSRTVRAGPLVWVAGTTATGPDGEVGPEGDLHGQTLRALDNVRVALEDAGARLEHVVQTRLSVTEIGRWEEAGRAHGEVFGAIRPVTAMVEVSALIDPRMLVEVEATAWAPLGGSAAPLEPMIGARPRSSVA